MTVSSSAAAQKRRESSNQTSSRSRGSRAEAPQSLSDVEVGSNLRGTDAQPRASVEHLKTGLLAYLRGTAWQTQEAFSDVTSSLKKDDLVLVLEVASRESVRGQQANSLFFKPIPSHYSGLFDWMASLDMQDLKQLSIKLPDPLASESSLEDRSLLFVLRR
jgi:hypothetical protein